jgi:hypothetical protein
MVVSRSVLSGLIAILFTATFAFAASSTFDGYTLVFSDSTAWLYGMDKQVVHQWTHLPSNSGCADLLRDSSLLWSSSDKGAWTQYGAMSGGRFMIVKWDGTKTWDFLYRTADYMPHHDMEPVYYTNDPKEKPSILIPCYTSWGDKITELKPTGLNTANVIWEWCATDHLCDSGAGTDKPEVLDKKKGGIGSFNGNFDKMHTNNISFNRTLNQIIISVKGFNELMVLDHSTTTAEAKGTTGGRYGKGGSILFRWGMPSNYGMSGAQVFKGQHCGSWIPDTMLGSGLPMPGAFNMMCVDNGNKRVAEFVPPGTRNGIYPRTAGAAYEPAAVLWTYAVSTVQSNEGTVQRLPNGNTIICIGGVGMGGFPKTANAEGISPTKGRVFEINSAGTIVWDLNGIPLTTEGVRYPYGYLSGTTPIEVKRTPVYSTHTTIKILSNPFTGQVRMVADDGMAGARLSLFSLSGRELINAIPGADARGWNLSDQANGQYLVKISSGKSSAWERISIQH